MKIVALERKSNARTPEGDEKRAKRTKRAEPSSEPVTETVTVSTQPAEAAEVDGEIDAIVERKKNGTLREHLIQVVRAYATAKVADEDDDEGRWAKVKTLSDEAIWGVIQWCEYERGACTMMARAVNGWAKTGGVQ